MFHRNLLRLSTSTSLYLRNYSYSSRCLSTIGTFVRNQKSQVDKPIFNFKKQSQLIIAEVEQALEPLKSCNDHFYFEKDDEKFVVHTNRGMYILKPDHKRELLILQSYFSGFHTYYFNQETNLWLSSEDEHDFRGLLTRDILRHHNGVPDFK